MSIADLLNEWFENDLLKAALAASGMLGSFVGPRQQGTAFNFLHHQIGESNGALRTAGFVRGGIGNSRKLSPARRNSSARKSGPEAEVAKDRHQRTARRQESFSRTARRSPQRPYISSADVKRTFLKLVEPTYLDPQFLLQVRNIRSRGTVAKINLALDALPKFKTSTHQAAALGGIIHIGPTLEYLERAADDAKYGRFSKQPFLEITIPSIADPSLAPAGQTCHVRLDAVRALSVAGRRLARTARCARRCGGECHRRIRAGL